MRKTIKTVLSAIVIVIVVSNLFILVPSGANSTISQASGNVNACMLDIAFSLDVSGSMQGARLDNLKDAIRAFLDVIDYRWQWRIGVVIFNGSARIYYDMVNVENDDIKNDIISAIYALKAGGGTNIYDGILKAGDMIKMQRRDKIINVNRIVILISDGEPTIGPKDPESLLDAKRTLESMRIDLVTFFIGDPTGEGDELMQVLASKPSYFFNLTELNQSEWRQMFSEFAQEICFITDQDGDGIPDTQEEELALKYLPILIFDSNEETYPTRVEFYYKNIGLYKGKGDQLLATTIPDANTLRNLAPAPWIDPTDTNEYYIDYGNDKNINISGIIEAYKNSIYKNDYTVYYHVTRLATGHILVDYWFFYPINNPQWGLDIHEGDWEHIALELDSNGNPIKYYISWHKFVEIINFEEAYRINNTHIALVVGKGTHASFEITRFLLASMFNIFKYIEPNNFNGTIIAPPYTDKLVIIDNIQKITKKYNININTSINRIKSWNSIINMGEPTNYRLAFKEVHAIENKGKPLSTPLDVYRNSTKPYPNNEFIDSKVYWGIWDIDGIALFKYPGPSGPTMHIDFYKPELRPGIRFLIFEIKFESVVQFAATVELAVINAIGGLLPPYGLPASVVGLLLGGVVGYYFYEPIVDITQTLYYIKIYSPINVNITTGYTSVFINDTIMYSTMPVLFMGNKSVLVPAYDDAVITVEGAEAGEFRIEIVPVDDLWGIWNISIDGYIEGNDSFVIRLNNTNVYIDGVTGDIDMNINIFTNTWNELVNYTYNVFLNSTNGFNFTTNLPVDIIFDRGSYKYGDLINASVMLPEMLNNGTVFVEVSNRFMRPQIILTKNFTGDNVDFRIDLTKVDPLAFIDNSLNVRVYLVNNTINNTMILGSISRKVDVAPHDVVANAGKAYILGSAPFTPGSNRLTEFYLATGAMFDIMSNGYGWVLLATYNSSPTGVSIPDTELGYYSLYLSNASAVSNMTIMLRYSLEELNRLNIVEDTLVIYFWDGVEWKPFSVQGVDRDNKLVWAEVNESTIPGIDGFNGTIIALGGSKGPVVLIGGELVDDTVNSGYNKAAWYIMLLLLGFGTMYAMFRRNRNRA